MQRFVLSNRGKQKKILEVAAEIMSTLRDSANQVVVDPRFVTFEKLITEEWGPEILSKVRLSDLGM